VPLFRTAAKLKREFWAAYPPALQAFFHTASLAGEYAKSWTRAGTRDESVRGT